MPYITCPHCSGRCKVRDDQIGHDVRCLHCRSVGTTLDDLEVVPDKQTDYSFGIVSIIFGCIALPLSIAPFIGAFSLVVSAAGIITGVIGFVMCRRASGRGLAFPLLGLFLNALAGLVGAIWILILMVPAGGVAINNAVANPAIRAGAAQSNPPQATAYKFGEQAKIGDLVVTVLEAHSKQCAGQYYGGFRASRMMLIRFTVDNLSETKIAEWSGWQGRCQVEDEHGNTFRPLDLGGWAHLPDNDPFGWDGDRNTRIHPQKIHSGAIYHEPAPASSRSLTISVQIRGNRFTFSGPTTSSP